MSLPKKTSGKFLPKRKGRTKLCCSVTPYLGARRSDIFRLCWKMSVRQKRIRLYTKKRRDGSQEYDWLPMTGELAEATGLSLILPETVRETVAARCYLSMLKLVHKKNAHISCTGSSSP